MDVRDRDPEGELESQLLTRRRRAMQTVSLKDITAKAQN
jgi:hypothetical protein